MHDQSVERNAICSIVNRFNEAQTIIYASRITSDHFHLTPYATMFDAVMDMAHDNKPINFNTLQNELAMKESFLNAEDIAAVESCRQDRPEYWLDLLCKYYLAREVKSTMERAIQAMKNPSGVRDILAETTEELFHLQIESMAAEDSVDISQVLDNVGMIPSKYPNNNSVIIGYPKGRPVVIGARPGMGKTTFACTEVLHNILEPNGEGWYKPRHHATMFSLEMSRAEIMRKLTCIHSGVPEETVRRRCMSPDQEKVFKAHFELLRRAPLMIYDKPHTPKQVCANLRFQAERNNTQFVVLDFFQRLRSKYRKDRQFYSDASNDIADSLKNVCSEPAMMVLSQLSREADMNTHLAVKQRTVPRMSHLKETGALEEDAYQIGLMYVDPATAHLKYTAEEPPFVFIDWGKNRGGNTGQSRFRFIKHKGRFQDV